MFRIAMLLMGDKLFKMWVEHNAHSLVIHSVMSLSRTVVCSANLTLLTQGSVLDAGIKVTMVAKGS